MSKAKAITTAAVAELQGRIPKALQLQRQIAALTAELKSETAAIKETLDNAGLDRYATHDGSEALLIEVTRMTWSVDKLEALLDNELFDTLCPRKAESAKLRKLLDSGVEYEKELRKCARASVSHTLSLRAPGEEQSTADESIAA